MKPKQTIEVLKEMKNARVVYLQDLSIVKLEKRTERKKQEVQALDHAITCVGAIEQIKWERDIAIQQLNELGYQFGEKIRSDEE
jgi:hypothetical protein